MGVAHSRRRKRSKAETEKANFDFRSDVQQSEDKNDSNYKSYAKLSRLKIVIRKLLTIFETKQSKTPKFKQNQPRHWLGRSQSFDG